MFSIARLFLFFNLFFLIPSVLLSASSLPSQDWNAVENKNTDNNQEVPGFFKTYGGLFKETGGVGVVLPDGGYLWCGATHISYVTNDSGKNDMDILMMWTNSNGDSIKSNIFGSELNEEVFSVQMTADNGFIIAGAVSQYGGGYEQLMLIKTDPMGDTTWTWTYESDVNIAYSVDQTDDGYLVCGKTDSFETFAEVFIAKLDLAGNTLWTRIYRNENEDVGRSIIETSDGGILVVGYSGDPGRESSGLMLKMDANGNILWSEFIPGEFVLLYDVIEVSDGYVMAGRENNVGLIVKTNSTGDIRWMKKFPVENSIMIFSSLVEDSNQTSYVLCGYIYLYSSRTYETIVVKADTSGNIETSKILSMATSCKQILPTPDKGYILFGEAGSLNQQACLIKLDSNLAGETTGTELDRFPIDASIKIYPNPASQTTTVLLPEELVLEKSSMFKLYDLNGRMVKAIQGIVDREMKIDLNGLDAGIYILEFSGSEILRGKLILE